MLFFGTETHHMLYPGTVIPTAIKDHDFTGRWEMLHIPLHVHLRFLPVRRRRQRDGAKHARADPLRESFDCAAFAGGIPPFKYDDGSQTLMLNPCLQFTEFRLQLTQLLHVSLVLQFLLA